MFRENRRKTTSLYWIPCVFKVSLITSGSPGNRIYFYKQQLCIITGITGSCISLPYLSTSLIPQTLLGPASHRCSLSELHTQVRLLAALPPCCLIIRKEPTGCSDLQNAEVEGRLVLMWQLLISGRQEPIDKFFLTHFSQVGSKAHVIKLLGGQTTSHP